MLQIDLQQTSLPAVCHSIATLTGSQTPVWPSEQPLQELADPRFLGTFFADNGLLHSQLAPQAIRVAATMRPNSLGWGGKKVRDAETWGLPEAQLLSLRAMLFVCRARGSTTAHIVDRWINVLERGDYSTPHCHYESDVAVVYSLDPGDATPSADGQLEIIDPRIPFCCPSRLERPTRGIMPVMHGGTMVMFPAEWLHYVKPYFGQRSRLTIAWNISVGLRPAHLPDPTQHVPGIVGAGSTTSRD